MKQLLEMRVVENVRHGAMYARLTLAPADPSATVPQCRPGQFVQIAVEAPGVMLRRPISVCLADERHLTLLVRRAGRATARLVEAREGDRYNVLLPLGNGFTEARDGERLLLVGGGVGVAPLLMAGAQARQRGADVTFVLGARTEADLLMLDSFEAVGTVHRCTDDGSCGHHGVVTTHPAMRESFNRILCCGPAPMMKAVAKVAREVGTPCEVSLENMMACGLGACLCCVEKTVKGNVCVCTEGPVFNINELTW